MMMKKIFIHSILTFIVIILSLSYFFYGKAEVHREDVESDFGEFFGTLGFICLAIAYGRTMVKLAVNEGGLFERVTPLDSDGKIKKVYDFFMKVMNKTHPYIGGAAIISLFLHGYLTSNFLNNLLLRMVLVVMAWQGLLGLLIMIKLIPGKIIET